MTPAAGAPTPRPAASSWLRRALPPAAIAALALVAYGGALGGDFVFDSVGIVRDNALLRSLGTFFHDPARILWDNRWFGYLTFALNRAAGGVDVAGYHAVNVAIHVASALLVFALVVVTFATPRLRASSVAPWSRRLASSRGRCSPATPSRRRRSPTSSSASPRSRPSSTCSPSCSTRRGACGGRTEGAPRGATPRHGRASSRPRRSP